MKSLINKSLFGTGGIKMKERIFKDSQGEELIIRHRKSAIFFMRIADLNKASDDYVAQNELRRRFQFNDKAFSELLTYLEEIAHQSWTGFSPREADSLSSDHDEYYDREFDNNGYSAILMNAIVLDAPNQLKENGPLIRMYKFNKRKFESFIFDFRKFVNSEGR